MLRQVEVDSDAAPAAEIEGFGKPSRRGFLGTLTKLALGIVAGVAHLTSGTASATYNYACCTLAKPYSGGYCAYNCWRYASEGYHERSWTCDQGGVTYTCFECTTGATCWQGTFACSDYWPAV